MAPTWSDEQLAWALDNTFSLPELQQLLLAYPALSRVLATAPTIVQRASAALSHDGKWSPALEDELEEWLDQRVAILKRADRHFWRSVIDDLRHLRAQSALMPEGDLV